MTSVMNPEIQAIQKKYRNKRDQASMLKQQEEMQQVYDKYGTSMMSGCLPLSDPDATSVSLSTRLSMISRIISRRWKELRLRSISF